MCETPSYLSAGERIWFATDKDVNKAVRNMGGIVEDYCGHSGLRKLFPEIPEDARAYEGIGPDTPQAIIDAVGAGPMNRMIAAGGILIHEGGTLTAPKLKRRIP